MEKPHKSFRPSIQSHFYKQMKKRLCMTMTLAMYNNSNQTYGKGHEVVWMVAGEDREPDAEGPGRGQ
eukprot:2061711-Pyramimonas_sp.AAC.1